ncbi:hypothetical protein [Microbacterium jejuense]|uniref:hypothetical protein n=1 Tax=Microbacterium jejuense TaxID=1263637 RepID=UPI0031EFCC89
MSTPTDSPQDELRALRARAYGPDADIADDPAALARLVELEDLERAAYAVDPSASPVGAEPVDAVGPILRADSAPSGPAPSAPEYAGPEPAPPEPVAPAAVAAGLGARPATMPPLDGAPGTDAPAVAPAPEDGVPDPASPARRPWWRRVPVLWAASVVAALLVGAGLAAWMQSIDSGHVAVLSVDPDGEWPTEMWGAQTEGSRIFTPFHGMSVLAQTQDTGVTGQDPVPCLTVFSGTDGNIYYGGGACGAGPFPASASLVVGRQAPKELRDAFGEGAALQFVLIGDEVHVYAKGPGFVQQTP